PGLVKAETVEIALDDDEPPLLLRNAAGKVKRVQDVRFRVQRRFRRIEVLRLGSRREGPAAETNDFAALIPDRKHQPPAKTVISLAPVIFDEKPAAKRVL